MTAATVLRPTTLAEAYQQLREAAAQGTRLVVTGAGTAADWGGAVAGVDAAFDTTGLDRILSYQPADMTVAVQAGIPLRTLQDALAEQGQRVALDAARTANGATVGGLLATADAGPSRSAFGSLRDLVIGATVLLADGVLARSGGHVIKNVAGYDLAKLFHGSLGTLGVVVELVLRLHPLPPASGTLAVPCDAAGGLALAERLLARSLEPTALEWCAGTLLARFEGPNRGLDDRARQAREIAGGSARWRSAGGDDDPWPGVAGIAAGSPGDTVLRLGTLPALAPWLAGRVDELATSSDVDAVVSSSLAAGVHQVRIRGGTAGQHAGFVAALRRDVAARAGVSTVCRWADGLAGQVPAWGEPPAAVAVMRAVKQAFDPEGRLGPGRFAPWF
jgi:glycolate oxidase FAD binding subunit